MNTAELKRLEELNRVALTDAEQAETLAFFAAQDAELEKLAAVDTSAVERMVHVQPMVNVLREDVIVKNFTRDELQESAPETMDGYWMVPRVVG